MAAAGGRVALLRNRHAVGETYQALSALTVVLVCVALVLGAVHAASAEAAHRAAEGRAQLQADIALDAIAHDGALCGASGNLNWTMASAAGGGPPLSFLPSSVVVVTLRSVSSGTELFLVGNQTVLSGALLFSSRPVAIDLPSGETVPGVLRVGLVVRE